MKNHETERDHRVADPVGHLYTSSGNVLAGCSPVFAGNIRFSFWGFGNTGKDEALQMVTGIGDFLPGFCAGHPVPGLFCGDLCHTQRLDGRHTGPG